MGGQTVAGTGSPQQPAITPQQQAEFERAQKAAIAKQNKVMAQLETMTDPRQRVDLLVKNGLMSPAEASKALAQIAKQEQDMERHKAILATIQNPEMRIFYLQRNGLIDANKATEMRMEALREKLATFGDDSPSPYVLAIRQLLSGKPMDGKELLSNLFKSIQSGIPQG